MPGTGNHIEWTTIHIYTIRYVKILEDAGMTDSLAIMQQIGLARKAWPATKQAEKYSERSITMSQSKLVLVTGATGNQGGACVDALLTRGHHVRALTRNSPSPAATLLHHHAITIIVGDFTDHDSLVRAARGVDAVYAMSAPYEQGA